MMKLKKSRGSSLLEVLISLCLISLIFFGFETTELYSMRETETVYFYSVALNQINNAVERLSALKSHEGFEEELSVWNKENKKLLPRGFGTISGSYPTYVVSIYWGNLSYHCRKQKLGISGCLKKEIQLE